MSSLTTGHRHFLMPSTLVYEQTEIPAGLTIQEWHRERAASTPAVGSARGSMSDTLRRLIRRDRDR